MRTWCAKSRRLANSGGNEMLTEGELDTQADQPVHQADLPSAGRLCPMLGLITHTRRHLMKQRVFVGSSTEGLEIAHAVQSNLEPEAEVRIWSQDVFRPGEHVLESLLRQTGDSDFGVFVFAPDDIVEIRNSEQLTVRDNVVFELGLCIGRLGAKRSFILLPKSSNLRIPSDLLGVNTATFDPNRSDEDLVAALGPACTKIRKALKLPNEHPIEPELRLPILLRRQSLTPNMLQLLNFIEANEPCSREELDSHFGYGEAELYYRLEYLRLLSLVSADDSAADPKGAQFRTNPDYAAARGKLAVPPRRAYSSAIPTAFGNRNRK